MTMREKKYQLILSLIHILLIISCQRTENQANENQTFNNYQRIISLSPSTTEILFALGLGEKLVGVTRFCTYPPEAQQKPNVGGYLDPNYEAIALLNSDLVIILPEQESIKNYLQELGINNLIVNNKTCEDILKSIRIIGDTCGATAEADSIIKHIEQKIDTIRNTTAQSPKPKVLICIGRSLGTGNLEDIYFAGRNTSYDEIINIAGGKNAFENEGIAYPMISAEGIITLNPDIIIDLIANLKQSELKESAVLKDWEIVSHVNALKNRRLHVISNDYVFIPGPRFIIFLEDVVQIIHPEIDWNEE